jgi:hypothetical protein
MPANNDAKVIIPSECFRRRPRCGSWCLSRRWRRHSALRSSTISLVAPIYRGATREGPCEAVYGEGMPRKKLTIALRTAGIAGLIAAALVNGGHPRGSVVASGAPRLLSLAPTTVNPTAYDAKMRTLANLPEPTPCAPSTVTASATAASAKVPRTDLASRRVVLIRKEAVLAPCPVPLWPAHAVYPNAGAVLPFNRIVAYYGNFYSPRMGVLGKYPPNKVLAMLASTAAAWLAADPSTPVVPALDYITVSAQDVPGRDGRYRLRMPPGQIEKAISLADRIHGLVFLEVQPGWSTVETEVPRLAPYLKRLNVELALDPEFAVKDDKRPGAWIGTMNAADINFSAEFLAKVARENHLPPKILVVHRFTESMVTDFRAIKPLPEVQIVMDMDGFGSPVLKTATYRNFIASQPVQFTGFKLFYKNDVKFGGSLMTPPEVLRLSPQPSYIQYQ